MQNPLVIRHSLSTQKILKEMQGQKADRHAQEKIKAFKAITAHEKIGFYRCSDQREEIEACRQLYKTISQKRNIKTFVQIGIGGSSLGTEMLVDALKSSTMPFVFINNIDPDFLYNQLQSLDLTQSLFFVVSKSGGTAETMAAFAIVCNLLQEKGVTESQWKDFFVFCTDPVKSQLKEISEKWQISRLNIAPSVGGRFCALTSVGLFPALFAGINIEQLFAGANSIKNDLEKENGDNPLFQCAEVISSLQKRGVAQTVLMPYSSRLRSLSSWFVQLWAESLGKKYSKQKEKINTGLTPVPSYGATDQHSQVQLFMEGPYDKLLILIEVENFTHDYALKNAFSQKSLKELAPYSLAQLMSAEFKGTLQALDSNNRPYLRLTIPSLNEFSLGALILFFESLTALMGEYLNVDPFDQPGVEAGKIFAFQFLEKMPRKN